MANIKKTVGNSGSARDQYYLDFAITLERLAERKGYKERLRDDLVGSALLWLAAREDKYMGRYPSGSLLANVVARHRLEDARLWLERRAGKDVAGEVEGPDGEGEIGNLFDLAVADDDLVADGIADSLLMSEIYAGIEKHFGEQKAHAFIEVEFEGRPVGEVANELGIAYYTVSKWNKATKASLARLVADRPQDFGLAN